MEEAEALRVAPESLRGPPEQVWIAWEARIRVLGNPFLLRGLAVALGAGCVAVTLLLLLLTRRPAALVVGFGLAVLFGLAFIVVAGVIDLLGGFRATFALTSRGIRYIAGGAAGRAADAAFWAGLLASSAAVAGAGLLAQAERSVFLAYEDVRRVRVHPTQPAVRVRGAFGQKPIVLYCTPESFDPVLEILRRECRAADFSGGTRGPLPRRVQ